jgi:hypothetical protein
MAAPVNAILASGGNDLEAGEVVGALDDRDGQREDPLALA